MQRLTFGLLGLLFACTTTGCDKPRPERVPPPAVNAPVPPPADDANVRIDAGGRRGVDVNVDVDPAPGRPGVKVDIDRPNNATP